MLNRNYYPDFLQLFWKQPHARAYVKGNKNYPEISGTVRFYQTKEQK